MSYYKVVMKDSLKSSDIKSNLTITYKIDDWVHANQQVFDRGYGLCVFNNLNSALKHASDDHEVYECEVDKFINTLYPVRLFVFDASIENILHFNQVEILSWPPCTVLVKSVKLIQRVK